MFTKVELAQDVLKQLECRKFRATHGYFWEIELPDEPVDAREFMREKEQCEVCARGALFLAALEKKNNILTNELRYSLYLESNYLEVFSEDELYEIEAFFEGFDNRMPDSKSYNYLKKKLFPSPDDRLKAIMENIVKCGYFDRHTFMEDNPLED